MHEHQSVSPLFTFFHIEAFSSFSSSAAWFLLLLQRHTKNQRHPRARQSIPLRLWSARARARRTKQLVINSETWEQKMLFLSSFASVFSFRLSRLHCFSVLFCIGQLVSMCSFTRSSLREILLFIQ